MDEVQDMSLLEKHSLKKTSDTKKNHVNTMDYWNQVAPIKLPGTNLSLRGYSIACYKTAFFIPELNIMLDSGVSCDYAPEHIFITHTHSDHVFNLPMTILERVNRGDLTNIYAPYEMIDNIRNFINATYALPHSNANISFEDRYNLVPMKTNQIMNLQIKKNRWQVETFCCDHGIPCLGYGFSQIRSKLRAQYSGCSQIATLRKQGVEVMEDVVVPQFCYLGDSTTKVFENTEFAKYPVVLTECTFFDADHVKMAAEKKHTHWVHLKPIVEKYPSITFVLYHFSKRYTTETIKQFFADQNNPNVIPWA